MFRGPKNYKTVEADNKKMKIENLPVFGICGWSGSGKTTLLVQLLPKLREFGLKIAENSKIISPVIPQGFSFAWRNINSQSERSRKTGS